MAKILARTVSEHTDEHQAALPSSRRKLTAPGKRMGRNHGNSAVWVASTSAPVSAAAGGWEGISLSLSPLHLGPVVSVEVVSLPSGSSRLRTLCGGRVGQRGLFCTAMGGHRGLAQVRRSGRDGR